MAILRRRLTGRSIYETDRGHLHHCLLRRGYSNRATLLWIGGLCACTAVGALVSVSQEREWVAIGSIALVAGLLVITRLFGHIEVRLLGQRIKHLLLSLIPRPRREAHRPEPLCTRLQGNGQWDELWTTLIEFANRFDLSAVQLNINLPVIHEEYHASWKRKESPDRRQFWHTDIPLVTQSQTVGRLRITGTSEAGSVCQWMGELIAGLKPFETMMLALVEEHLAEAGLMRAPPAAPPAGSGSGDDFEPLAAGASLEE
jgi:UDP-GlcNAc:undecaprenyl-phosphate GlcNAc-1-phosphate transferase